MSESNNNDKTLSTSTKKIKDFSDTIKNDSLVTMGAMKACEELFEKHKALVASSKDEMIREIQKNDLSKECADFCLKHLDRVTQLIRQFTNDKLHHYYAKVGALNAVESCIKLIEAQQREMSTNLPESHPKTDKSTPDDKLSKRPDDESTKMGKKLKDIKARKQRKS